MRIFEDGPYWHDRIHPVLLGAAPFLIALLVVGGFVVGWLLG